MKLNSTKSKLLSSILMLTLCVSMLIGTTFAWFTDSVVSGVNKIVAGNLDVELEYSYDGENWNPVTENVSIFKEDALWEPGHTEAVALRVKNAGTLAFKYDLSTNVYEEKPGTNVKGEAFKLSDYLKVYHSAVQQDGTIGDILMGIVLSSRDNAVGGNEIGFNAPVDIPSDYIHPGEAHVVVLAITMPATVGNEANYQTGTEAPSIKFGINVLATQFNHESDSFGNDYDAGLDPAAYSIFSGKDLHKSSTKSGKYTLAADIKTSAGGDDARYGYGYEYIIRNQADYTLNLNGKTITHDTVNENANHNALTYTLVANHAGTKLTINGNGKIYSHNSEGYTCAVQGKDGTLITINGGEYDVTDGIAVWAGAGSHIVINGGSFVNGGATTDHELIYSSGGVIDIYGGFFHNTDGNYTLNIEDRNRATGFINVYGGTFVNFDPSTGGQDPSNIKVADGYKVVSETQANGDVWYTVVAE